MVRSQHLLDSRGCGHSSHALPLMDSRTEPRGPCVSRAEMLDSIMAWAHQAFGWAICYLAFLGFLWRGF